MFEVRLRFLGVINWCERKVQYLKHWHEKIKTNFIPKLGFVPLGKCGRFILIYGEIYVTFYLHKIRAGFIIVFSITPNLICP